MILQHYLTVQNANWGEILNLIRYLKSSLIAIFQSSSFMFIKLTPPVLKSRQRNLLPSEFRRRRQINKTLFCGYLLIFPSRHLNRNLGINLALIKYSDMQYQSVLLLSFVYLFIYLFICLFERIEIAPKTYVCRKRSHHLSQINSLDTLRIFQFKVPSNQLGQNLYLCVANVVVTTHKACDGYHINYLYLQQFPQNFQLCHCPSLDFPLQTVELKESYLPVRHTSLHRSHFLSRSSGYMLLNSYRRTTESGLIFTVCEV